MTEQLISFPIAKLAKEKGFDENCYQSYNVYNKELSPFPLLENMGNEPVTNPLEFKWKNSLIHKSVVTAPTQALLAKWLREIHNIHISCHPLKWNDNKIILYNAAIRDFNNKGEYYSVESINYENALELALEEGLKLIENK